MDKKQLNRKIKVKFGKLSRFARLAGIPVAEIHRFFIPRTKENPELESKIVQKLATLSDRATKGEIPGDKLGALKTQITAYCQAHKIVGFRAFCRHAKFDYNATYQIIYGRRRRITKHVKKLFKFFNIELHENTTRKTPSQAK